VLEHIISESLGGDDEKEVTTTETTIIAGNAVGAVWFLDWPP
jgi:hypothetical protein